MKFAALRALAWIYLFLVLCLLSSATARAACDLQITSAGPCLGDGVTGMPRVGEIYGLRVYVKVVGTPSTFRIKWTMANITYYFDNLNPAEGNHWWYFQWWMDLDDPIPWSVTLDSDGVSGDTDRSNNFASGTFIPQPPSTAVELYAPRVMDGVETRTLVFQPGSGTLPYLYDLFGVPTTHGAQRAISSSGPLNSRKIFTPPNDIPIFEVARLNVPAATFNDTETFTIQLHRVRVNPTLLRAVTWADMDVLTPEWKRWLAPDQRCQSIDPSIAAFVHESLPADYRKILTPYDTARTLHKAVMKKLTYESPHQVLDAVGVLKRGATDCGGYAALETACLRNVGIPARCISGFREGESVWHVRLEFHLPGTEWIVADPTDGDGMDPTGTYAYYFGNSINADSFMAIDIGDSHIMPYNEFPFIQVPNWWWGGGATYISTEAYSSLHPRGILPVLSPIAPHSGLAG